MAGLDGIQNEIDPGDPLDRNIYELPPEEAALVPTVPGSLGAALDALEGDHEFLMQGGVFTQDVLDMWLGIKREEVANVSLRPDALRVRTLLQRLIPAGPAPGPGEAVTQTASPGRTARGTEPHSSFDSHRGNARTEHHDFKRTQR